MKIPEFGTLDSRVVEELLFKGDFILIPVICCWADKNVYYGLDGQANHFAILDNFSDLSATNVAYATKVSRYRQGIGISTEGGTSIEEYTSSQAGQEHMLTLLRSWSKWEVAVRG